MARTDTCITCMHLAYYYVVASLMLAEINSIGPHLGVAIAFPIRQRDLTGMMVFPPPEENEHVMPLTNKLKLEWVGGRLDNDKYAFGFSNDGRLQFIWQKGPFGGRSFRERDVKVALSKQKSLITTNEAYKLATNWIASFSADVNKLEREGTMRVSQESFMPQWPGGPSESLPLFRVEWWSPEPSKQLRADIEIDGRTKRFLELRLEDESISGRPSGLIRNRQELLNIPNKVFLKYSPKERQDLVERESVVHYEKPLSEIDGDFQLGTNLPPQWAKEIQ